MPTPTQENDDDGSVTANRAVAAYPGAMLSPSTSQLPSPSLPPSSLISSLSASQISDDDEEDNRHPNQHNISAAACVSSSSSSSSAYSLDLDALSADFLEILKDMVVNHRDPIRSVVAPWFVDTFDEDAYACFLCDYVDLSVPKGKMMNCAPTLELGVPNPLHRIKESLALAKARHQTTANNSGEGGMLQYISSNIVCQWFDLMSSPSSSTRSAALIVSENDHENVAERLPVTPRDAFGVALLVGSEQHHAITSFWCVKKDLLQPSNPRKEEKEDENDDTTTSEQPMLFPSCIGDNELVLETNKGTSTATRGKFEWRRLESIGQCEHIIADYLSWSGDSFGDLDILEGRMFI